MSERDVSEAQQLAEMPGKLWDGKEPREALGVETWAVWPCMQGLAWVGPTAGLPLSFDTYLSLTDHILKRMLGLEPTDLRSSPDCVSPIHVILVRFLLY